MEGEIRVLQNCKVKAGHEVRAGDSALQLEFVRRIPEDALIRVIARGDADEWTKVLGLSIQERAEVEKQAAKYAALVKNTLTK